MILGVQRRIQTSHTKVEDLHLNVKVTLTWQWWLIPNKTFKVTDFPPVGHDPHRGVVSMGEHLFLFISFSELPVQT